MSCKEAIEMLKKITKHAYLSDKLKDAVNMAITALEIQDGNLYLRDVKGPMSIGIINGNVYMGGYEEDG